MNQVVTLFTKKLFLHNIVKRIGASCIAILLLFAFVVPLFPPKQAEAIFVPVIDVPQAKKELFADGVFVWLAQVALQRITQDTVNWINSGFKGNPGFVTNPEIFARDVGDSAFNAFLTDEALGLLCSPFRINIQLALRTKYLGLDNQYYCTIEDAVGNITNFYNDFANGGWGAWFTMTQQRQNLPYGAYLDAEADLYTRIGSSQTAWNQKLNWGRGILSWDECSVTGREEQIINGVKTTVPKELNAQECPPNKLTTHTPGTLIEGQLIDVFGSGLAKLEAADEINEIVMALIDQFTYKLITGGKGLLGLKGSDINTNPRRPIEYPAGEEIGASVPGYCGSFGEGLLPTAALDVDGPSVTFTSNRRDVTVQPGEDVTFSWCGTNANVFGSSQTVRRDLSAPTCTESGTAPWIANNAYDGQTISFSQAGCAYEIIYAARNTAFEDVFTGDLTVETDESKIIVRVGQTPTQVPAGQCTITTVTSDNIGDAAIKLTSEVTGTVSLDTTAENPVIYISSINGNVGLTPVEPSSVNDSLKAEVAATVGCSSTSQLTFMVFQVTDPNQLPPEILNQLGSERPNQILIVIGS